MSNEGYWIGHFYVVDLEPDAVTDQSVVVALLRELQDQGATRLVIDVSDVDLLHGQDLRNLEAIVSMCSVSGVETIVASMRPDNAAILVHFVEEFRFVCAMSVDRAVHALQR